MKRRSYSFYECGWKCAAQMAKCICTHDACSKKCEHFPKTLQEECNVISFYNAVATVKKSEQQLKIAKEFINWVALNAETESRQTIRDKAIETEFRINHPEMK